MGSVNCERADGCPWAHHAGMCANSCYATYSRELTAKWDREDADLEARGKYIGCPVCKQQVRFSCYHDGVDYSSVELPATGRPPGE